MARNKARNRGMIRKKTPMRDRNNVIRRKKADIRKSETTDTIHHRRPTSIGGLDQPSNIAKIPLELHKAWTIIAGNMNAEQICNHINIHFRHKGVTVICLFINGRRCTMTGRPGSNDPAIMSYAWQVLFRGMPRFKDKIEYINNVLLDPSYHLYIKE